MAASPPSFSAVLAGLKALEHTVPENYRSSAKELAAVIMLSGREVDIDRIGDLMITMPLQHHSLAAAVITSFQRLPRKERDAIANWARVLITFQTGKREDWEVAADKRRRKR